MRIVDKFMHGRAWPLPWLDSQALEHSARTAVAAVVSVLAARLFGLPEAYWAALSSALPRSLLKSVRLRRVDIALSAAYV